MFSPFGDNYLFLNNYINLKRPFFDISLLLMTNNTHSLYFVLQIVFVIQTFFFDFSHKIYFYGKNTVVMSPVGPF